MILLEKRVYTYIYTSCDGTVSSSVYTVSRVWIIVKYAKRWRSLCNVTYCQDILLEGLNKNMINLYKGGWCLSRVATLQKRYLLGQLLQLNKNGCRTGTWLKPGSSGSFVRLFLVTSISIYRFSLHLTHHAEHTSCYGNQKRFIPECQGSRPLCL
jgi:hypothetical protein